MDNEQIEERGWHRFLVNHAGFIGWLIVVAAMAAGFFQTQNVADQVAANARIRAVVNCESQNELKNTMWEILELNRQTEFEEEAERAEAREQFMMEVEPLLREQDCNLLLEVPPPTIDELRENSHDGPIRNLLPGGE